MKTQSLIFLILMTFLLTILIACSPKVNKQMIEEEEEEEEIDMEEEVDSENTDTISVQVFLIH